MAFSKEQLRAAIDVLYRQKRALSAKTMATKAGLPVELLSTALEHIGKLPIVKPDLTPSGKFRRFSMTYAAQGYVFVTWDRVWVNGRVEESAGRRMFESNERKRFLDRYQNMAVRDGLHFCTELTLNLVADKLFALLYPDYEREQAQALLDDSLKHMVDFPAAMAKVRELLLTEQTLIARLQQMEAEDLQATKTYEVEMRKADSGLRMKDERYSVQVGVEEEFVRMEVETSTFWGLDGQRSPVFRNVPVYETRTRRVRDDPAKPFLHTAERDSSSERLKQVQSQIESIKHRPASYQKSVDDERKQAELRRDFQRESAELAKKYALLGLRM